MKNILLLFVMLLMLNFALQAYSDRKNNDDSAQSWGEQSWSEQSALSTQIFQ